MILLEKISDKLNFGLNWVAGGLMVGMMALLVGNMIARQVVVPFGGTSEIVGFMAAMVVAFALGYTQIKGGHVAIDLVVTHFPRRVQRVVEAIMSLLSLVLFVCITWQCIVLGNRYLELGSLAETTKIIFYPFIYAVAFGSACMSLALLVQFLKYLLQAVKK
ncbi:MAG: TRAP transporter small permease [Dehalococcoidia bacterium]|nr:TRAP transporter small permease [Dehalococcoidia bacterium]